MKRVFSSLLALVLVLGLGLPMATIALAAPKVSGWFTTGSMATARYAPTATLLKDGKVLIAGGSYNSSGGAFSSAELYDPKTGSWSATGSMSTARWYYTATLLKDGKVLVAGGFNSSTGHLSSAEVYTPSKKQD